MMLWMDPHRRTRRRLSAYIDRQLSARDVGAVEAHLSACDECRTEATELRATVLALRALPPLEPPRSFALTPEMVRGPERPAPVASLPPVQTGMRLAAAGLAVALAVVFVADAGNVGQDSGGESMEAFYSAETFDRLSMESIAPAGNIDSAGGALTAQEGDGQPTGAPGVDAGVAPPDDSDSNEPPDVSAPGPTSAPAPSEAPKAVQDMDEGGEDTAVEDEMRLTQTGTDGGQDTLRTVEIALAAALALAVAASVVLAVVGRRR